ncbi:uncharacterized protein METZ01_LOCUS398259, partial [marine metagenome]
MSDAVEWAWTLQAEPTVQWEPARMLRQGNPWQNIWDVGSNTINAAGSLLAGDLGGAREAWTHKEDHMYGYAPNPYGGQVGNALGIHNWMDAGFALLDLADIASFVMPQGMIIRPIRQSAAHAQIRMGNHEIARIIGGKPMREEFAERAARAADTELRTVWDNISTGEREVIEADYRAVFPDADPDPVDMMRWYEQQGPPGTPEEARIAWANDPQRIEDQVAREAERLDIELANLNPDPKDKLLEWSDLDDEVREAFHNIVDDLGRSLGEHVGGRNLTREVEEYLG